MLLIFNKESAVPTKSRAVQVLKDAIKHQITFLDVDTTTIAAGNHNLKMLDQLC